MKSNNNCLINVFFNAQIALKRPIFQAGAANMHAQAVAVMQ